MKTGWGKTKGLAAAVTILAIATAIEANAADYDVPPVFEPSTETTQVELGTGWYIRGDIGMSGTELITDDLGNMGYPVVASASVGYRVGDSLRAEATGNLFTNLSSLTFTPRGCGSEEDTNNPGTFIPVTGNCFVEREAEPWAASMVLNGYYDLPMVYGLRPYIGLGAGIGMVSRGYIEEDYICEGNGPSDCGSGGGEGRNLQAQANYETELAFVGTFNAMLGASYTLSDTTALDFGYRYTYLAGSRQNQAFGFSDGWSINEFRLGMRMEIW